MSVLRRVDRRLDGGRAVNRLEELKEPAEAWAVGAVEMTAWHRVPWGDAQAAGVYGEVRVINSEDAVGFTIRGGDHANWMVLVRGVSVIYIVPGCRVAAITYGATGGCRDFLAVP